MSSAPASAPPAPADAAPDAPLDVAAFYQRADGLCRCALEATRQRERLARLSHLGAISVEQRAAQTLVALCDAALADLVGAYERAADRAHPPKDDACWHAANGLWLASREFARRTQTSARAGRAMTDRGDRARLTELALDYDLEASALLLLKQAAESYRRVRPQAV